MQRSVLRLGNIITLILLILVIAVLVLQYIPTDYVVYMPGPAEEVGPMVETGVTDDDEGQFLLTAVYQSYPNMLGYLQLLFNPHAEFHVRDEVFVEGENEEQYAGRQMVNMLGSQSSAIMAVYEELGIAYHYKDQGLFVSSVLEGMPAEGVLQMWDRLDAVDGIKIESSGDLLDYLAQKKEGDVIELAYTRGGGQHKADIELKQLPPQEDTETNQDNEADEGRGIESNEDADTNNGTEADGETETGSKPSVGIGVGLLIMRSVEADDEQYRVTITAEDIGGPSAGLMFALEIYNRFVPEDISKGYKIAGTGEISPDGAVGVIGGIRHKVIGADSEGADIFLAPADYIDEAHDFKIPNYSDAVLTAEQIGSTMEIVEVRNLSDALDFLQHLPAKESAEENG